MKNSLCLIFLVLLLLTVGGHSASSEILKDGPKAIATFAGGDFRVTEPVFEKLAGVEKVVTGYAGGRENLPAYDQVLSGKTTHAFAVQVYYDPKKISFEELLKVFFATHDPTTLNSQASDSGRQYRSIVFYRTQKGKSRHRNLFA